MRDVLREIGKWYDEGETFGLATVVNTFRSAPRPAGAAMAVSGGGEAVGSVSGGCVEGAVYELARRSWSRGGRSCSGTASATTTRSPSG